MVKLTITDKGFDILTVYQALVLMPTALEEGVKLSAPISTSRHSLMKRIEKLCPSILD